MLLSGSLLWAYKIYDEYLRNNMNFMTWTKNINRDDNWTSKLKPIFDGSEWGYFHMVWITFGRFA